MRCYRAARSCFSGRAGGGKGQRKGGRVAANERAADVSGETLLARAAFGRSGGDAHGRTLVPKNGLRFLNQTLQTHENEKASTFHTREGGARVGVVTHLAPFSSPASRDSRVFPCDLNASACHVRVGWRGVFQGEKE